MTSEFLTACQVKNSPAAVILRKVMADRTAMVSTLPPEMLADAEGVLCRVLQGDRETGKAVARIMCGG